MNYNTTYSYPRQEQMVSYQICADDVQDIYWVSFVPFIILMFSDHPINIELTIKDYI